MKRIDIIIKGRKLTEKLFGLKRKQINRAIEAARDYAERQHEDATMAYEALFTEMADDSADYQRIISKMIQHKLTIIAAETTIAAIDGIKADLEKEVEEPTEQE